MTESSKLLTSENCPESVIQLIKKNCYKTKEPLKVLLKNWLSKPKKSTTQFRATESSSKL